MVQQAVKAIKLDFDSTDRVTSFGGTAVAQRLFLHLGVGAKFERFLPPRRGYSLQEIVTAAIAGLLAAAIDVLTSPGSNCRRTIATLRRWLLAVPARIRVHGRTASVTILGLTDWWHTWIGSRFRRAARC